MAGMIRHAAADASQESNLKPWEARPKTGSGTGSAYFTHLRNADKNDVGLADASGNIEVWVGFHLPIWIAFFIPEFIDDEADCIVFAWQRTVL